MSSSVGDNTTIFGDRDALRKEREFSLHSSGKPGSKGKSSSLRRPLEGADHFASTYYTAGAEERPFFVPIGKGGLAAALETLNRQLTESGRPNILSKKVPVSWIGREITPGNLGLINHGGNPKILTRPGRYPGFPLRNWWARSWAGTKGLSDAVISFQGLTVVQVSQNQAAVVSDPSNSIFGTYDVLSVVDQTHLPNEIRDPITKNTLGWTHEVMMSSQVGSSRQKDFVVATFLNIPANNCAILQRGNDLELLSAGQSVITNPSNQIEMPTKDIFTRDQVPVSLRIYLKWQLTEPLKLATHGYNTPYDALRDKTQSILTQIVAHLDYSSMVKQRSLGPDNMEDGTDPSSAFLDALRTRAMDEMLEAAIEYGIVLRDLAVIDRQFKGEIAATMDKLTTRALQAQVEAANVDRENSNKVKQEEGALSVARIKAQARNTQADAEAYSVIAAAKAQAERVKIEAEAEAEAEAIRTRSAADILVTDVYAREVALRRLDVSRVQAFGDRTIFVPFEGPGAQMGSAMALGMAANMGANASLSP
ncbi:hypothetical protein CYLTODRAFT_434710 [Cylindrobasidium torrendii FP15055 ss-10]|uniref:Band 7 domain-containing protein n=1 Tax=Cylindrobasidium torrendii FP15055 ss-10 TaxID=1314674 RepID=A0A0D7BQK6_9AGAR|nr:hypothetical protein CYLTODRAFT_434710 [Cylindrobasidium torrendii FP15055 ss-10]